ncbi:GNAT family N-acetyltransferase [Jiangella alkaliphila]|uniref:Acetyltransferase (GNAT) family protein n=1 Tax=Jiangella alkaliphila TaxID=419479 RepID=A0A1H2J0D2_9ACTN|nr:GNAT family N-acetyltransferase [Jiangella alkaliphila]SDU49681.1 Acetyltransferase (GNAT) family protein [Jiangella alkaliphila]
MLSPTLVELPDHAALVARSAGHPFVRWHHSAATFERAWVLGGAAGWTVNGRYGPVLVAVGDGADAGLLTTAALSLVPAVARIVVAVDALPHVDAPLGEGDDWDWFWTTSVPTPPRPGEAAVVRLGPGDQNDLVELLHVSSPRTSARADDASVRTWFGVRDEAAGSGRLVACAAEHEESPGVWHLRAIATHPSFRGRGLGADVTAAATRAGLTSGATSVTLGMYADNHVARRMYERLGFRVGQSFATRAVARPTPS